MTNKDLIDEIGIALTKRDARAYADAHGLDDMRIVVMVPDCNCNAGLDDSTADLKCPVCGKLGVVES